MRGLPVTAPQVTPADVEAAIASEHYFTAGEGVIGAFASGEFDSHSSDVVILRRDIASTEVIKPSLKPTYFLRPGPAQRLHRDRRERLRQP